MITFEQVSKYHENINEPLQFLLQHLENHLSKGRDDPNKNIPIYLTKWRVKNVNSIYIKTKRKKYLSLEDITDYAGFRVLCLFEKDLIKTTEYLIAYLNLNTNEIKEIKFFNWNEKGESEDIRRKIEYVITKELQTKNINIESIEQKDSGYKSIHFLVYMSYQTKIYPIEIQVRTLFQDVWSELGHFLVYKQGNVHPHIQRSFYLLSRDIQTNDLLMNHLRSINDKEKSLELFSNQHIGPYKVFGYEDQILPKAFNNELLKTDYQQYLAHIDSSNSTKDLDGWIIKADALYEGVAKKLKMMPEIDPDEALKAQYWLNAEAGFLAFKRHEFDKAIKYYKDALEVELKTNGVLFYVPNFRIGEIYFIKGDILNALIFFDQAESKLQTYKENSREHHVNSYRVNIKMANIYWQLGKDYIDRALNEVLKAELIYKTHPTFFDAEDHRLLINNLCWYHLDKYISSNQECDYIAAQKRYEDLEPLLQGEGTSANAFDTAMWFCLQTYYKTGDMAFMEKAQIFCKKWEKSKIRSTNRILSLNIYRNHIQEIMSTTQYKNS